MPGRPPAKKATRKPGQPSTALQGAPATQVLRKFRIIFNAVKTHFQDVERHAGIGGAQVWALSVIGDHPGIGVGGLAVAMDIHQTTASNLVKGLLKLKLIAAARDDVDRRMVQLSVLPGGAQLLKRVPGPFQGVLPNALAQLDAKTLLRLEKDLAVLIDVLQGDESAAGVLIAQK